MTNDEVMNDETTSRTTPPTPAKRAWLAPTFEELPRLTKLTLSSSISGSGIISNGNGSTVF